MFEGKVFAESHNWTDDIIERLSWLTNVIVHRDGSEQRRQCRLHPRRMLEYSVLPQSPLLQTRLDNFLWSSSDEAMVVPIWTDAQRLGTAATSGTDTVTLNTVTYDYDTNGYVILWRSPTSYEVVAIDTVASGSLTLAENLDATWPVGTVVAPARLGRLTQQLPGNQIAYNLRPYKLIFEIDEASYSTNRITSLSPTQYLSTDTFEFPTVPTSTESSEDLDFNYEHTYGIIDAQTGAVALDTGTRDTPYVLVPYAQKFRNRAQISEWWGFLNRRQGRRVPVWVPSWEKDFLPTSMAIDLLNYTANGYADLIDGADGRKDLMIYYEQAGLAQPRGQKLYKRITGASDLGGGVEQIAFSTTFMSTLDYDKIRVSFLRYCRLESDTAEMAWKTSCIGQTRTTLRELYSVPS